MTRFLGALARAFLVLLLAVTPSAVLPDVGAEQAQVALLLGLFMGIFVLSEYSGPAPGLIGFRDAPPINRLRFLVLFLNAFCLSALIAGPESEAGSPALLIVLQAMGQVVALGLDFPGSPLRLMVGAVAGPSDADAVATMCGLAFLISGTVLVAFAMIVRRGAWPLNRAPANLWVLLPTFDPARGALQERLRWDGRFCVVLGLCLPFLLPMLAALSVPAGGGLAMAAPQTLVWVVAFWSWAPVAMVMRGLAMMRLAGMAAQRGSARDGRAHGLVSS
ncbi:hypothetical protein BCF33_1700 [Hasllibacter halocynthiae]|uniref:Uncharacterized protein n=1 Tax=Hasllibacter halocynthiae TaxID=595589 RepID=A0A2T0X1L9_9RHOB|nr:hypothetical protein [Hasllibacter halocynthiae]PRY92838.1 hypothetical protein BCF33_1700 [Hasllibacter halocynthiae]